MNQSEGKRGKTVRFQVTMEPGSEVFVAGTFNNWNPTQHPMRDSQGNGIYKITLVLPRGSHEYKFVVNGGWHADPNCPESVINNQGSMNSVITV